ncbi:MAG: flap endonuclease Xni [Gammaproteobacteria bacterium]|nr:flap endonuclease Xni [Gammaproteobacteria bacterium]
MKVLLVDGLNLVRRIYAAVPDEAGQAGGREPLAGIIASCTASLQRALNRHRPSHCLAVFDGDGGGGRNWRRRLYPDYKKNRPPMPAPLRDALPRLEQAFAAVGVDSFSREGFEADDIIATVAVKIARRGGHALILSTDRNYCQLLGDNIAVFDHFAERPLDRDLIAKRFQVEPQQLPDALALAGDSGLSIPGVRSVGIRTAARLLAQYGDLENVLQAAAAIPGHLGRQLAEGREHARLAKTLFTLNTGADLGINLSQLRYNPPQ